MILHHRLVWVVVTHFLDNHGTTLGINTSFGTVSNPGTATTAGNALVQLGQNFIEVMYPSPEIKKYSGEILYIDNRASITRSASLRKDIKIVLEFKNMPQETNLNVSPYFDDFNEDKNFNRILFKPASPVQN